MRPVTNALGGGHTHIHTNFPYKINFKKANTYVHASSWLKFLYIPISCSYIRM